MNQTMTRPRGPAKSSVAVSWGALDRRVTAFCKEQGGKCFDGWPIKLVHQYVVHHLNRGQAIVAQLDGKILAAVFAWPANEQMLRDRALIGATPFAFGAPPSGVTRPANDCLFLAEVIGSRKVLRRMNWPDLLDLNQRRLMTYRKGELVELSWETVWKFLGMEGYQQMSALREGRPLATKGEI